MQKKDRKIPNQLIVLSSAEKRMPLLVQAQDSKGGSGSSSYRCNNTAAAAVASAQQWVGALCDAVLGTGFPFEAWQPSNPYNEGRFPSGTLPWSSIFLQLHVTQSGV